MSYFEGVTGCAAVVVVTAAVVVVVVVVVEDTETVVVVVTFSVVAVVVVVGVFSEDSFFNVSQSRSITATCHYTFHNRHIYLDKYLIFTV